MNLFYPIDYDFDTILFLHSGNMMNNYHMIKIKLLILELIGNNCIENTEQIDQVSDDLVLFEMIGPYDKTQKKKHADIIIIQPVGLNMIYSWIYNNLTNHNFYSKLHYQVNDKTIPNNCFPRQKTCFSLALDLCFIDLADLMFQIDPKVCVGIGFRYGPNNVWLLMVQMLNHNITPETNPKVFNLGLNLVKQMLKYYAPAELDVDRIFTGPMFPAVKFKTSIEPVKILLSHGLNPNGIIEGMCPIAHSIIHSNYLVTKFLLDWGVDLETKIEQLAQII